MIYEHEFIVDGNPKGKERPRMARGGHVYTPKTTTDYEKLVKESYYASGGVNIPPQSAISMQIIAYMPIPKSDRKAVRTAKLNNEVACFKKPDIDNIAKIIMDALQGENSPVADDSEVVYLSVQKKWSDTPRTKIKLYATVKDTEVDDEKI